MSYRREETGVSNKSCFLIYCNTHTHIYVYVCMLSGFSHVQLFATPWTVASQAPLSRRFSRLDYWSGLPCPFPRDLPDPGIKPTSLMSPALAELVPLICSYIYIYTCLHTHICVYMCMCIDFYTRIVQYKWITRAWNCVMLKGFLK